MVTISVDGRSLSANSGDTVLQALLGNGIEHPHICYHPRLGPLQTCDTCLVEVGGKQVRACSTPLTDGMKVAVATPSLVAARMQRMKRLLQNHNLYCTVCEKNNGDCILHNTALRMGVETHEYRPKPYPIDDSNPFFQYNPDQCILCGRCVEACQDLVVNEVLSVDWSLKPPRVVFDHGKDANHSSCVSCGTCSSVCPVDALLEKTIVGEASHFSRIGAPTKQKLVQLSQALVPMEDLWAVSELEAKARQSSITRTKTVCTFCGVGCSFEVWTRGRQILKVLPREDSPANGMATCIKGKFGWSFVNSPERLTQPLIRRGETFAPVSWEEAISYIAKRLTEIKAQYGPDSIGVIATCTGTDEEAYLTQKFARQVIGTHNVDNCARYCQAPASMGLARTVGIGADSGNFDQIEQADLLMLMGTNTAEAHPVLAGKIKRSQKLRGTKVVVFDVRRHEMAERANEWINPKPGSDLAIVNAIAKYVLDRGWEDKSFIASRCTNFEAFTKSLEPFTLEFAEKASGIPQARIVQIAEMVHAAKRVCILWAMGITQHGGGSDTCTAFCNLLLLTGNFGRPGTGGYPLRGHCNVQGASDFGALPATLPGYQKWDAPEVVARFEKAWGVALPKKKGLTSVEMTDAMGDGRLKALYILGEDKLLADANQSKVASGFSKLDFMVVQELFLTRTAEFADVILPVAASLEKEGTFVSTERRLQRLYRVMEPLAGTRTDFDIVQAIARAMGADWNYAGPQEVLAECASLTPAFAGATWERLEGFKSLLWPVAESGEDSPFLYKDRFAFPDGKAHFFPTAWTEPEAPDAEYDLSMDNGRMLEHFHWGNMTALSPGLEAKVPEIFIEVSPELAQARDLQDGDLVRIASRVGALRGKALVTSRVSGKTIFLALHNSRELAVNQLTGDRRDPPTTTPAYKELPVKLEKIPTGRAGEPESPLPRTNPRFATRSPQIGVEVERKWAQSDYVPLET
ncbi:MAG: formate dehydrogenase subunit alpha [Thermoplasmata archaeon]